MEIWDNVHRLPKVYYMCIILCTAPSSTSCSIDPLSSLIIIVYCVFAIEFGVVGCALCPGLWGAGNSILPPHAQPPGTLYGTLPQV